jgi:hypothetical protein
MLSVEKDRRYIFQIMIFHYHKAILKLGKVIREALKRVHALQKELLVKFQCEFELLGLG